MQHLVPFAAVRYLWAAPVTLAGVVVAGLARLGGGRVAWRDGVLEAWGGPLSPLLRHGNPLLPIAAITLGHVVLARREEDLVRTRRHERVHVRQYERWGPCFPMLYLGASLVAWLGGGDAYRDNRFEREARAGDSTDAA